ncbi:hypothetical protein [Nocardia flavorosea]|uniref:Uncharacterized protein n=1 Tax=Nocardia flavorosea TaxID=53429 RepID=A0A846YKH9_9NOCA|nr:hypothetical protein [Nocardia flavorosea]NKY58052.1 hypothetical protein [Nocardia flavorosea]
MSILGEPLVSGLGGDTARAGSLLGVGTAAAQPDTFCSAEPVPGTAVYSQRRGPVRYQVGGCPPGLVELVQQLRTVGNTAFVAQQSWDLLFSMQRREVIVH